MKKLLSFLLLFVTFGALAQTYDTLPTGSKPYGNFYLGPDGNLVFGNAGLKFRVIGTKKRVDSLLALKADLSQLALYQTKALLQQDLSPSSSGYPSVNAVIGGLNSKANSADLGAYQAKSDKGQSNGYAGLDGSGKVPLTQINDALLGAVNYRGTYNAATNSPTLPAAASSNKGYYYIVSTAGTQFGLTFRVGDWIISNGSAYGKVASSSDVESVNGKKGVVNVNLDDVLTAGNVSEQAMSVGAIAAGSAGVTSAPTQPSHVVRLDDISAGKTIGANAASATLWGGYPADFGSALNPQPDFGIGFKNGKAYTIDRPAFRQWVGINDGSLISNSIVGNAATASGLSSYNGANTVRWGWDGNFFTAKVDNADFGNTIPLNISGKSTGTSLQDVTNVNNATTLPIRTNGYGVSNDFDGNYKIGLATGVANKGVNIGYNTNIDAGFIGVVENATAWRNLVLQPIAGNVGIGKNPVANLDVNGSARVSSNDGSSTAVARNVDLQGKANLSGGNSFTGNGVQIFMNAGDQRSTIQPGVFSVTNTASTAYSALGLYDLTVSANTNQTSYKNGFINSNVTGTALSFDLPSVSGRLLTGIKTVVTLDFPNVMPNQNAVLQRTVANVAANDVVTIGLPNSLMSTMTNWNGVFQVWVSAANTLSFRFQNNDPLAAHDLPDTTFTIFIHKQ